MLGAQAQARWEIEMARTILADRKRLPDPSLLAWRFTSEFEALVLAVLLGPWLQGGRGAAD